MQDDEHHGKSRAQHDDGNRHADERPCPAGQPCFLRRLLGVALQVVLPVVGKQVGIVLGHHAEPVGVCAERNGVQIVFAEEGDRILAGAVHKRAERRLLFLGIEVGIALAEALRFLNVLKHLIALARVEEVADRRGELAVALFRERLQVPVLAHDRLVALVERLHFDVVHESVLAV